jgi:hypothetical protein
VVLQAPALVTVGDPLRNIALRRLPRLVRLQTGWPWLFSQKSAYLETQLQEPGLALETAHSRRPLLTASPERPTERAVFARSGTIYALAPCPDDGLAAARKSNPIATQGVARRVQRGTSLALALRVESSQQGGI